ncbi:hypothetical protein [Dactylosporangium sp. CA-092794]|uniref:hypothetical protein n=1 Tax=Dactylosporangium sp. CA-092794 TaxID=3239929 RepID=UPI003D9495A5
MATPLRLTGHGQDQLQTQVQCYVHPDTGRRITLISTMHVGEPAYFAGLRALIDALTGDGAVVHSEGSALLGDADTADAAPDEQAVVANLTRYRELDLVRVRDLGWIGQVEGLGYPPHWQIHDLTYLQITRRVGTAAMRDKADAQLRAVDWPDGDRDGPARYRARAALMLRSAATADVGQQLQQLRILDPAVQVLIDDRNTTALDAVFGTGQDIVLIWGPLHVPGLDAGLAGGGFVPDGDPTWRTVGRLPDPFDAAADAGLATANSPEPTVSAAAHRAGPR